MLNIKIDINKVRAAQEAQTKKAVTPRASPVYYSHPYALKKPAEPKVIDDKLFIQLWKWRLAHPRFPDWQFREAVRFLSGEPDPDFSVRSEIFPLWKHCPITEFNDVYLVTAVLETIAILMPKHFVQELIEAVTNEKSAA